MTSAGTIRQLHPTGFTLIELVVVLAVIATVSAIAVPRYTSSLFRYRADAAARRIVSDLAYARSEARISSAGRTVIFDTGSDSYTMPAITDFNQGATPYIVSLALEPYMAAIVSAAFDDPGNALDAIEAVTFDGYGTPDSGGTVVVAVGPQTRTIVLDPDTGKAAVQ